MGKDKQKEVERKAKKDPAKAQTAKKAKEQVKKPKKDTKLKVKKPKKKVEAGDTGKDAKKKKPKAKSESKGEKPKAKAPQKKVPDHVALGSDLKPEFFLKLITNDGWTLSKIMAKYPVGYLRHAHTLDQFYKKYMRERSDDAAREAEHEAMREDIEALKAEEGF